MDKLLSVVIPVYNAQAYLKRCIESILNQTYPYIEIILVNDGSTDDSGKICEDYALRHKSIKVLHQTNQGQSIARNKGIEYSSGEFITFVDSDDFITDPTTYESCISAFSEDVVIVQYPYHTYHSDSTKDYLFSFKTTNPASKKIAEMINGSKGGHLEIPKDNIISEIRAANHWNKGIISTAVCDKVFKRSILDDVKFRPMFLEDVVATIDVLKKICMNNGKFKVISKGEYAYCIRDNSTLTSQWTQKKSIDEINSILYVYDFILQQSPNTNSEQAKITYFWIVSMMTSLRIKFGINWFNIQPSTLLPKPNTPQLNRYQRLRLSAINLLGIKGYINFAYFTNKIISSLKK